MTNTFHFFFLFSFFSSSFSFKRRPATNNTYTYMYLYSYEIKNENASPYHDWYDTIHCNIWEDYLWIQSNQIDQQITNPRIKSTVYINYQKSTYIWMCGPNEWYLRMINNIKFMSQWIFFLLYILWKTIFIPSKLNRSTDNKAKNYKIQFLWIGGQNEWYLWTINNI